MSEKLDSFIPTRGSVMHNKNKLQFQEVTYQSYKTRNHKESLTNLQENKLENKDYREFNLKKAKYEVLKFGMSSFDPQKKEEAEVKLAVKLGAKPPKNKYKNYKLLQAERKKEKDKETSRLSFQQLGKNSKGKSIAKGKSFDRKRRKGKSDILTVYGKVKV